MAAAFAAELEAARGSPLSSPSESRTPRHGLFSASSSTTYEDGSDASTGRDY
jgi:hypothetical protein